MRHGYSLSVVVNLVLYFLRLSGNSSVGVPGPGCICAHVVIVIVKFLLLCKLLERVIDAFPLFMLLPPLPLHPVEFVLIELVRLLVMALRSEGLRLWVHSYFMFLPGLWLVLRSVFVLHFDELVDLFLVEILAERALPLRDFYLQAFGPLRVLVVQAGHSLLPRFFLMLPLQYLFPSAVPSCQQGYLWFWSTATLSMKYFLRVSMVLGSNSVCSRHF